jgi:uncharacterized protein YggU (UPF0235/DUF167 family)
MYIHVKMTPKAKRESFEVLNETHVAVAVKEPAERNLANTRMREMVAEHYLVPVAAVRIISGHHSRSKLVAVHLESEDGN